MAGGIFKRITGFLGNTKAKRLEEKINSLPDPEIPDPEQFVKEKRDGYNIIDWPKLKRYAEDFKKERERIVKELYKKAGKYIYTFPIVGWAAIFTFIGWMFSFVVAGGNPTAFFVVLVGLIWWMSILVYKAEYILAEMMERPDFPKELLKMKFDYFKQGYKFSLNPAYDIYKSLVKTQTIERVDVPHQIIGMVHGTDEEEFLESAFEQEADALVGMSKDVQYHTEIKSLDYNRFTNRMSANTRTTKSENFQATGVKILPTEQTKNDAAQ